MYISNCYYSGWELGLCSLGGKFYGSTFLAEFRNVSQLYNSYIIYSEIQELTQITKHRIIIL